MVMTETELKADVREMTGYKTTRLISDDGLDTAYRRAERHIRVEKSIGPEVDFFDTEFPERQETLFWFTCLFAKVQTGELDSQDLQVGAINQKTLLAKDDDSVTQWYRMANDAMKSLKPDSIMRSAAPARPEREYEPGTYGDQSAGSGSEVDSTDL